VRLFCPSVELRNRNADAFLLNAGAKSPGAGVICPDAEAPDSARQAHCPSMELRNCNVDAFLLDVGAKSLGVGAICPDARAGKGNAEARSSDVGAKRLDDAVPFLAQEATKTVATVLGTDRIAESIGRGRQSVSAITFSLRYARPVFRGGMDDHAALADRRRRDLRRRYRV
jgi:hypothetical protein